LHTLYGSTNTYFKIGPNVPNFPLNDGTFLTPEEQVSVMGQAAAAWYIGTVFTQVGKFS
jgi:hypothetical protein